jgi:hypothetical protein
MLQSKQSVTNACVNYYNLSKTEIFAEENSKSVCIALTLKYCQHPLGTEEEQDEAVTSITENPSLKRDFETIEQNCLL